MPPPRAARLASATLPIAELFSTEQCSSVTFEPVATYKPPPVDAMLDRILQFVSVVAGPPRVLTPMAPPLVAPFDATVTSDKCRNAPCLTCTPPPIPLPFSCDPPEIVRSERFTW